MHITSRLALVFLALLCLGLTPADVVAPAPPGLERVEPLLEIRWHSLNASASVNIASKQVSRSLNMNGEAAIIDRERVVGVCPNIRVTDLIDAAGTNLIEKAQAQGEPYFIRPHRGMQGEGGNVGLNWSVPELPVYPSRVSRLAGHVLVLTVREGREVELPLGDKNEWVSLAAGLRVKVVQCVTQPNNIRLELDIQSPHSHPFMTSGISGPQTRETPYVYRVALVDETGNSIDMPGLGGGLNKGKEARWEGRYQGMTHLPAPRTFKTLRLFLVTKIEMSQVPFEIKDLVFPSLQP